MKLIIDKNLSRYYLQTLCLLFFPGAKFSESEEVTEKTPVVTVTLDREEDGAVCTASIRIGDKEVTRSHKEPYGGFPKTKTENMAANKAFFNAAEVFFGYTPPWGILTGVRPTKIVLDYLNEGMTKDQTVKELRRQYLLYPKKAIIATDIARNELKIIKKYPLDTCSVYISIPFCPTRCSYCSFVSFTTKKLLALIPAYLEALKVELSLIARQIKESGFKLKTVYIGGGTPTTLNEEQLEDLLAYIDELFDTSSLDEFTLEAGRPDTITEKKLQSAYDHNVTRISINPQSLNNFVLQEIDRCHTAEMFFKAYEMARKSGIPCINTDLIMGLPTDDIESYSDTLEKIIELSPENITAHTFCVKRSADILKEEGQDIFARENFEVSKCVDYTQIMTKKAGYIPYYMYRQKNAKGNLENVGYCKKGTEGIYNILMMEEIHSIFSAGAGAVTKLVGERNVKIERIFNPKYPYEYLEQDRYKVFEQTKKIMEGFFAKL